VAAEAAPAAAEVMPASDCCLHSQQQLIVLIMDGLKMSAAAVGCMPWIDCMLLLLLPLLQVVKVYVSVYSDDEGKEQAINNLKRIAP
jgi:preprotein translocase subunit SecY